MNTQAISSNQTSTSPLAQNNHFKVLRLLAANPQLTQRELSEALGVSLGKTNYCIQALLGIEQFRTVLKQAGSLAVKAIVHFIPHEYDVSVSIE